MGNNTSQDKEGARRLAIALHTSHVDDYDTATHVEREQLAEYGEWLAAHYYELADIDADIRACDLLCYDELEERIATTALDAVLDTEEAMDLIRDAIDDARKRD